MARWGGRSRAKTIRMRIRTWHEVRAYLVVRDGAPWSKDAVLVMDYLEVLAAEPCGRTVPRSVLQALAFGEDKGGVPVGERISEDRVLQNYVADLEENGDRGHHPRRRPNNSSPRWWPWRSS